MTQEQTLDVIKVLLRHIGNNPEQDKALAQGAIVILDSLRAEPAAPAAKKAEPTAPGDSGSKASADSKPRRKRKPFDVGKMRACLNAGRSVAWVADEMGVSQATIYKHMKSEGIAVGS